MLREELVAVFRDTVEISRRLGYDAEANVLVYKEGFRAENRRRGAFAEVVVCEGTTFDAARAHREMGRVAVLNFANPVNPGGGVAFGAMAQEECLCRSSNLYLSLLSEAATKEFYAYHKPCSDYLYSDRLIYSMDITIFKSDAEVPQCLPESERFTVDVITCAAPFVGKREHTDSDELKELFKSRITNIIEAAIDGKVDVLVLGAFGCGAFGNPPKLVAKAFHEVIEENGYREAFRKIVFAIKSSVGEEEGRICPNLSAFSEEFERNEGGGKDLDKMSKKDNPKELLFSVTWFLSYGELPKMGDDFHLPTFSLWREYILENETNASSIVKKAIYKLSGKNQASFRNVSYCIEREENWVQDKKTISDEIVNEISLCIKRYHLLEICRDFPKYKYYNDGEAIPLSTLPPFSLDIATLFMVKEMGMNGNEFPLNDMRNSTNRISRPVLTYPNHCCYELKWCDIKKDENRLRTLIEFTLELNSIFVGIKRV